MSTENVFAGRREYESSWNVKGSRLFNDAEKASVARARVVTSQYGLSVCFLMKTGKNMYIPLSSMSNKQAGDSIDLNTANIVTLEKEGEDDIVRIEA